MNKVKLLYRTEQVLIILIQLLLLWWIMYVLQEGATMSTQLMLMHFVGIGIFGALLIRGCAYRAQKRFETEQAKKQIHG